MEIEMTIEVWLDSREFANRDFPENTASVDLEVSFRNFERALEAELRRMYPASEITVRVAPMSETTIHINHEDVAWTDQPQAKSVYVNIRYAIDKLYFYGEFWVYKHPDGGS